MFGQSLVILKHVEHNCKELSHYKQIAQSTEFTTVY